MVILWKGIKGETAQVPAPRRSAFVKLIDEGEEEEDKDKEVIIKGKKK